MKITWTTEKRKLSELIEFDKNPRYLTDKQKDDLKKSLQKFGLAEIPAIDTDNTIIAGHQRTRILAEIEGDIEIDVRVPNRKLTKKEFEEYNIRSNRNVGSWSNDLLSIFDKNELQEWGFFDWEMIGIFGINDLESKYKDKDTNFDDLDIEKYTKTNMIWINDVMLEFEDDELKESITKLQPTEFFLIELKSLIKKHEGI